jgi:predicted transposase YbfD/YdcC
VAVKANQPSLLARLKRQVQQNKPLDCYNETIRQKGRRETRCVSLYEVASELTPNWAGVQRLIYVERVRETKQAGQVRKVTYSEHFYMSSLAEKKAQVFAEGIRGHWGIENRLHWVKDVIQREDGSAITQPQAAANLSILKNIAINVYRKNGYDSIKRAAITFANKIKELLQLLKT